MKVLCPKSEVLGASLKAHLGHLEAGAAIAGLVSLMAVPLSMISASASAQLIRFWSASRFQVHFGFVSG